MFVIALVSAPSIAQDLACYLAVMDYVRYAFIGFRFDSDLVSQISTDPLG